jgi:hypothetical protein
MITKFKLYRGKCAALYRNSCRRVSAFGQAPSQAHAQALLFAVGVILLVAGLSDGAIAELTTKYNDTRISGSVNAILTYIEGAFGALVMVSAGIASIISAAFGQYRAALSLLAVALGAFILRSIISTFFNDQTIQA